MHERVAKGNCADSKAKRAEAGMLYIDIVLRFVCICGIVGVGHVEWHLKSDFLFRNRGYLSAERLSVESDVRSTHDMVGLMLSHSNGCHTTWDERV